MKYILDDNDNVMPCEDVMKWGKWFEENRIRRILCRTHVTPDVYVSTVFLALDHGLGHPLQSKPILWETMVVGLKGDIAEEYEGYERYDSREDAIKGHLEMVDKVIKDLKQEEAQQKICKAIEMDRSIISVVSNCPESYVQQIQRRLSEGYRLHGPPQEHCAFRYAQYMKKEGEK